MQARRALGGSTVSVTRLGLGTAALVRGDAPPGALAATVSRAREAGIGYVDTAPMYGCGDAERTLGDALDPEASVSLSTKVGRVIRPLGPGEDAASVPPVHTTRHGERTVFDFSAEGVRRSFRQSVDRLGGRRPDAVYVHDPDLHYDEARREAIPEVLRWRERGEIGAVGVGMNGVDVLTRAVMEFPLDCVLVAGRYTLLDRSGEALLDLCAERGVGVVIGGVFNSGLLADPLGSTTFDYAPAGDRERAAAQRMARICAEHGADLKTAALLFPLRHPAVVSVLLGPASPEELAGSLSAAESHLPEDLWEPLGAARLR